MTTRELINKFNNEFGLSAWPSTYEVDAETYANVCIDIFKLKKDAIELMGDDDFHSKIISHDFSGYLIRIAIGLNGGIMFKNVELILKCG